MCYMVLIKKKKKLPPSVVPIHPHHTINAEGCHIAGFKRRNCKKALTLIRTNAQQEKTQTKAKLNLGGTLCGGITEEGRAGWLQSCLGTWMLTRWISEMFILTLSYFNKRQRKDVQTKNLAEILTLIWKQIRLRLRLLQFFIEHRWTPLWGFMGANLPQSCIILVLGF